jgi:signal transduction histidine kinase
MKLFERLEGRSVTTQIASIVAVSVLLGMALTVTIIFLLGPTIPKDSPPAVASRIAQIAMLVRAAKSPAEAETIIAAARNAGFQVNRVPVASLEPLAADAGLPFSSWLVVRQLDSRPGVVVLDRVRYPAGPKYQVTLKLDDADALVFDATVGGAPWRYFLTPTTGALIVVLISVLLLSIYAVRWIVAPLAAVAEAALSFGRSPNEAQTVKRRGPREIRQVADALAEMRTRIRALLDDRTRMLAAISHDLRTPLTRLRLRAERVGEEGLRDAMLGDLAKVERMLDDTLDYLRQDGRAEPASRVDLPSLLQTICSDFADVGYAVSYAGPARLAWTCRPKALSRALINIVDNGVKHGGSVVVGLGLGEAGAAEIEISDDGPGIPATLRDKVFEPFFKANSARGEDGGFGLGLSIAQDIVKRHGGDIRLIAGAPAGLLVRLSLPAEMSLAMR